MHKRQLRGRLGQLRGVQVSGLVEWLESRALLSSTGGVAGNPPEPLAEHVPGEILVQFRPQVNGNTTTAVQTAIGGVVLENIQTPAMLRSGTGVLQRISIAPGLTIQQAIQLAESDPSVVFAEPNYLYRTEQVSNDPQYTNGSLWGTYSSDNPVAVGPVNTTNIYGSQAEQVWDRDFTGSSDVYIGVIDEGIQFDHPDLIGNMWLNPFEPVDGIDNDNNGYIDDTRGWDFAGGNNTIYDGVSDDHGTHCAGTIGATGGNGTGLAGVSWDVTMISAKFLGSGGGTTANAVRSVDYLTDLKIRHNLNIVATSNSWGGGGFSNALLGAIIRGAKADILFIAAAGNGGADGIGDNNDSVLNYPSNYNTTVASSTETAASYDAVVAVAAITSSGSRAVFSNFGRNTVDLGAPGVDIVSTVPSNNYASYQGTSMATPHVSGAVALYASLQQPGFPAQDLRRALFNSVAPTPSMATTTSTGGRLDVAAMVFQSLITITPPVVAATTEAGGQTTFDVYLRMQPSGDVTIPISSSNTAEGITDVSSLVFTPANWSVPQTVTLTGVDDFIDDGNINWDVVIGPASSSDALYNGKDTDDLTLTNLNDDFAAIGTSDLSGSQTTESGGTVTFNVFLNSQPLYQVTLHISSTDLTEADVSVPFLIFDDTNWNIPQTVTVTGQDDAVYDRDVPYQIRIYSDTIDPGYMFLLDSVDLVNIDNEPPPPPKFFVVDGDGFNSSTIHRYDPTLSPISVSSNDVNNTAPRGIATTAAGQRLWVIDTNQNVYVYSSAGVLEGSWRAAGLPWNALPEGIATDGTNIWIVDNRSDRVFYYPAAASRTSGTQSPRTNFALAIGNNQPRDIVYGFQNGVGYLWTVNDDLRQDRVFRYTLNAQGVSVSSVSWLLGASVVMPTGITLDPSNSTMDIWVVDDANDSVVAYRSARTLIAPAPYLTTLLGSGNSSPQGIADPPPTWTGDAPTVENSSEERPAAEEGSTRPRNSGTRTLVPHGSPDDTAALVNSGPVAVSRKITVQPQRTTAPVDATTEDHASSTAGSSTDIAVDVNGVETASVLDFYFTLLPQLL
ncbi:MAG: S8 family serine peptidase [Planctomycetaceae bacterium]